MERIKVILGILLIVLSLSSFVELFNKNNTESIIVFLIGTMFISSILGTMIIKSINK
jgi:hypothetical protein